MDLRSIQDAIRDSGLDGWLFFDHHRRDPLAYRILGIPPATEATRRWYYLIPAKRAPSKLVHQIESRTLDGLPGEKLTYTSWGEQHQGIQDLLRGCSRIAMQYSPQCSIPYISNVDAGTVELIRGFGIEVSSSANLVQQFEARWTGEQLQMHLDAGQRVDQARRDAFRLIRDRSKATAPITEFEVQQFILARFSEAGLVTDHGPIVAVNEHASDPHYEPNAQSSVIIQRGDLVLIDLWAKLTTTNAVYYDVTWVGYCGERIPIEIQTVFEIVTNARDKATEFAIEKTRTGQKFAGFEVDNIARRSIEESGFGSAFFHRTGHNIGTEVHGTGANMDDLESHDDRQVIARTCFSVEPGIYLPPFGIRSEVNVYVGESLAMVTGEQQKHVIRL